MKYCSKCGKEMQDGSITCADCGCAASDSMTSNSPKASTLKKKQWIIFCSILFVVFALIAIILLTSEDYIRARDSYSYLNSSYRQQFNFSDSDYIQWQTEVESVESQLTSYYIGIGICSVLALASLASDILLIVSKNNHK